MPGPLSQIWGHLEPSGEALISQAAGTTTVVAGVAGQQIVVFSLELTAAASATAKFTEVAGDVTGAFDLVAGTEIQLEEGPAFWTTVAGEALQLTTTGGPVHGVIVYAYAPALPI